MDKFLFNDYRANDIFDEFTEEKVAERYELLFKETTLFIKENNLENKASVNKRILADVVLDYFYDTKRLKNFHVDIKRTHGEKVIAYISYWLLHRKPIQIIDNSVSEENEELVILNEKFVLQYIVDFLSKRIQREHVLLREEKGLQNFSKLLLYYLVHRLYNAQSLEMMIIAFFAGQIYENIEKDISEELRYYS